MHSSTTDIITIDDLKALSEDTLKEIRVGCQTPQEVIAFVNCALLRNVDDAALDLIRTVRARMEETAQNADLVKKMSPHSRYGEESSSLFSSQSFFDKF